jgi:hypothetical protein
MPSARFSDSRLAPWNWLVLAMFLSLTSFGLLFGIVGFVVNQIIEVF